MSYHPSDAISWIREIEAAQNIDDLRTSYSIQLPTVARVGSVSSSLYGTSYGHILRGSSVERPGRSKGGGKITFGKTPWYRWNGV